MTSILGLDLGGTNIKLARVDLVADADPRIVETAVHPTPEGGSPEMVVARLAELASGKHGRPVALGVGVPGQFDQASGVIRALPNLAGSWSGFPLRRALEEQTGLSVTLLNDAQGFTLAESRLGAARGATSVVGVALGTGIGGGVLTNGSLNPGVHGTAGEIGHQVIIANSPTVCSCGNRGCLESVAKAAVLTELAGRDSTEEVFAAAADDDERALAAIATVTDFIGIGLANVLTIIDPEILVIGGGVADAGDALLDPIRAAVARHLCVVPVEDVRIVRGSLGTTAGAVGAALAVHEGLAASRA